MEIFLVNEVSYQVVGAIINPKCGGSIKENGPV